jgi:hypothetical protein
VDAAPKPKKDKAAKKPLLLTFRYQVENYQLRMSARSRTFHKFMSTISNGEKAKVLSGPFKGLEAFLIPPGLHIEGIEFDNLAEFNFGFNPTVNGYNLSWLRLTTLDKGISAKIPGLIPETVRATYTRSLQKAADLLFKNYMQPVSGGMDFRYDPENPAQGLDAREGRGGLISDDEEPF